MKVQTLKELDEQIMALRTEKSSLEDTLYNTCWKSDSMADPLINRIDKIQAQIEKLRDKKEAIKRKNYKGEFVKDLGNGCHFSSLSLKEFSM